MFARALLLALVLLLPACVDDVPCADHSEDACLDDDRCAAQYLESCGCSCGDDECGAGCCEFDICADAG